MWLLRLAIVGFLFSQLIACQPITRSTQALPTAPPPPILTPTAAPPTVVTFHTGDGVSLTGILSGAGPTVVILSNMGDNDPEAWNNFAPQLVEAGYRVLTYQYRYPLRTSKFTNEMANQTVADLEGAVAFARSQGAKQIVLIGASLGGMATAKVAASTHPAAIVIIGAPHDLPDFGFKVEASEMQAITVPKLIIASKADKLVPFAATKQFFEWLPEPKEMHSYEGAAHGVQLFGSKDGDDFRQQLLNFVALHAPR